MRWLVAAFFCFVAVPTVAFAQSSQSAPQTPQALSAVYACSQIQDDHQRLACYDSAVGHLQQAESQGQVVAVDRQQAQTIQREAFGFNLPSMARILPHLTGVHDDPEINSIQASVTRIYGGAAGYSTFVLDNGQSWTEVEQVRIDNVRVGDHVTVRKAALGSFRLIGSRGGQGYRVRRQD